MSSRHHDIAQSTLARSRWQRDIAHGERASHDGVRLGLGRLFYLLDRKSDQRDKPVVQVLPRKQSRAQPRGDPILTAERVPGADDDQPPESLR